jgi:hypothetical protein
MTTEPLMTDPTTHPADDTPAGFSADWLRQREPFDLAARSGRLALAFRAVLKEKQGAAACRLVDLAAGSGANFRALAPLLEADQAWCLVDHDPRLLAAQRSEIAGWASRQGWRCDDRGDTLSIDTGRFQWTVRGQRLDLDRQLEDLDLGAFDGLVTTAFLDLVSAGWVDRLCTLLARACLPLLATLTVDGRRSWHPVHPSDRQVHAAFLAHQGGDKGFGEALGVQAAARLAARLSPRGYEVTTEASDWRIGPGHGAMLTTLLEEAAAVAGEAAPSISSTVSAWRAARLEDQRRGALSMEVGHLDLLAVPARFRNANGQLEELVS